MRTKAMALVAAVMMISATTPVFAADTMKHDMQRDVHVRMGMAVHEDAKIQSSVATTTTPVMKHDMQRDTHVAMGMAAKEGVNESVTQFTSSITKSDQRQ